MCSISDIYDKCVAKECDDHELFSYRERNAAQTRYSLLGSYHTKAVTATRSGQ